MEMQVDRVHVGRYVGRKKFGIDSFSPTQKRIAKMLCAYPPVSTEEITQELGIKYSTLYVHINHMMEKVDLYGGLRALTVYLMHHNYLDR
jgi:DNA-binding CsgD family transcriptional regulator